MFDLGFWELALVALVALIVIGPERLPQVMRTTGMWLGRLKGMTLTVREELENEFYHQDINGHSLDKSSFEDVKEVVEEAGSELTSIGHELKDASNQLREQQVKSHSDVSRHGK